MHPAERIIIDHMGIPVSDFETSKEFYAKVLAPLNYQLIMKVKEAAGFGVRGGRPRFWIGQTKKSKSPLHVAFRAENREQVRRFYETALAAGGKDNGHPGLREIYYPNYYGAFILDPDGNNIEAVCHDPE